MELTFYKNTSSPNTLDKSISVIGTAKPISPTTTVEMLNPVLVVDYDNSLLSANYCYIDLFDRYYYCTLAVDTASRLIVSCKVDPLMTAKNSIKNCSGCILRNENVGVNYVIDDKLPIDPNKFFVEAIPFESFATGSEHYILVLNRGV